MDQLPTQQFDLAQVEDSVGYLLSRSKTMLTHALDEALGELGISHSQGSVFLLLMVGKCDTAAGLARELFIDSAAMKRTIDKMVVRGFIDRIPDTQDRRLLKLSLTDSGLALAQQLSPIYRRVLNTGFSGFTQEEIGFLKCLLRKLLQNKGLFEAP